MATATNTYLYPILCLEVIVTTMNIFWFVNWLYHLLSKHIAIEPSHKLFFYVSHIIGIMSFILSPALIVALILEFLILNVPQSEHDWLYTSHNLTSAIFYVTGKICTYIVLLLRIKTLLNGSIFELNRKIYFKIIALICMSILLFLIQASTIYIAPSGASIYSDIFSFLWFLSDVLLSIILTKLYLSKLTQIYQTIVKSTNNHAKLEKASRKKNGKSMQSSKDNKNQLSMAVSTSTTDNENESRSDSRSCDNNCREFTLFEMIVRFAVLEVVIIVSSVAVFVSLATLNVGAREDISYQTYYFVHLDSAINIMSICFMFNYATPFYKCLCKPCHWITRKCLVRIDSHCCKH